MKKTFSQKWFTPKKLLIYFGLLLLYSYLMVVFNDPLVEKDGPFIKKYPTGQIEMKGTVKNGKEDGVWEIFYETGELQVRGTYKNGIRDGSWKMFDEEGNLVKSETYKNILVIGSEVQTTQLDFEFGGRLNTLYSSSANLEEEFLSTLLTTCRKLFKISISFSTSALSRSISYFELSSNLLSSSKSNFTTSSSSV